MKTRWTKLVFKLFKLNRLLCLLKNQSDMISFNWVESFSILLMILQLWTMPITKKSKTLQSFLWLGLNILLAIKTSLGGALFTTSSPTRMLLPHDVVLFDIGSIQNNAWYFSYCMPSIVCFSLDLSSKNTLEEEEDSWKTKTSH